ncbi:MAG TPA: YihY/virulence factor BrkB family protein [Acidisarcina sp.]
MDLHQQLGYAKHFGAVVWSELLRTRAFVIAAALAFYSVLSLVPMLVIFSSLLAYLPVPNVFNQLLDLMAEFVPPDAMTMVQHIMVSVMTPHRGGVLSFGILGYLWASTGGFSAMIEALDIAYDVKTSRSWWRDRVQALLLTFTTGGLLSISLLALMAGPRFGHMLTEIFPIPRSFAVLWPSMRLAVTFITFVLGIAVLYALGPNIKHRFGSNWPGALITVFGWFAGSYGFSFYLRHFANYNNTYGSLGAVIVLMLWFYIIALATLIGAELNAELLKRGWRDLPVAQDALGGPIPGIPTA